MRVLVHQAAPVVGGLKGNVARLLEAVEAAGAAGAQLLVGTELGICGYPPRDRLDAPGFVDAAMRAAERVAQATAGRGLVAIYGAPWRLSDGTLINAAVVAHDGRVVAVRGKQLLPCYDVFDEPRHFRPGDAEGPVEVAGLRVGVSVCEDLWALPPYRPDLRYVRDPLADQVGCDVAVNLSASPFHAGKAMVRRELVAAQARRLGAPLVYVNQVGANDHVLFDGRSIVAGPDGELVDELPAFVAVDRVVDLHGPPVFPAACSFAEEVYAALVMGVRDYAGRCGFRRAVIGLSGGIDSALVAAVAVDALGADNVLGVGLPGPYSSEGSVADARELAERLGIRFEVAAIGPAWEMLRVALASARGGDVGGAADLAAQNLQARIRGTLLMGLANAEDRLLLTTGNKSEIATGYCTLYGDMNGALAVIGDVYKTEVYALAAWVNRDGVRIPVATMEKPPSAELAPGQLDSDSLPPYPVLDAVLRPLVEDGASPAELVAAGFDAALVQRVDRLLRLSEYKRWQAAPVLRVSRKAFGYGRRMPLASSWEWDSA